MVVLEVGHEVVKIPREGVLVLLRDEAVDLHLAVLAAVQVPGGARDVRSGDRGACLGDGASAAEGADPDHDFELGFSFGGGCEEGVEGDVRDEVVSLIAVVPLV